MQVKPTFTRRLRHPNLGKISIPMYPQEGSRQKRAPDKQAKQILGKTGKFQKLGLNA